MSVSLPAQKATSFLIPASFNMNRVIDSINTYFNPSRDEFLLKYHVTKGQDGHAYVTFVMPEGMTRGFIYTLQGIASVMRNVDNKAISIEAENKANSFEEKLVRENYVLGFSNDACAIYKRYIDAGRTQKEAISLTNKAMKAKYPNATYDVVVSVLRSSGSLRTKYKKR